MDRERLLRQVLGSESDKKSVTAGAILDVLENSESYEEKKKLLAIALVERDSVQKQAIALENKDILGEKWDELNKTHLDIIRGHQKKAFFKTSNAVEFAGEVLRLLDFFNDRSEKIFTLGTVLYSPYVPYKDLPGVPKRIPEHRAANLLEAHKDKIDLIRYIANLPFGDLLEEASLILQVLDDTNNNELRIALLAAYIGNYVQKFRKEE